MVNGKIVVKAEGNQNFGSSIFSSPDSTWDETVIITKNGSQLWEINFNKKSNIISARPTNNSDKLTQSNCNGLTIINK